MPQRRRIKQGSFGDHFDGLVTQFPPDEPAQSTIAKKRATRAKDDVSINDKLLESAWREGNGRQPSRFSNQ